MTLGRGFAAINDVSFATNTVDTTAAAAFVAQIKCVYSYREIILL